MPVYNPIKQNCNLLTFINIKIFFKLYNLSQSLKLKRAKWFGWSNFKCKPKLD